MNSEYPLVISIAGPTASGKSDLAQLVALELNGEVVSADSMQIYRHMDIGTAKIPACERKVPHHLIDIIDPDESYSASLFQRDARKAFLDIAKREHVPIICGGTGFYIQAALEDMNFPSGEQDDNPVREKYERLRAEQSNEALWQHLKNLDAASAELIHPNNYKRVIRALEMHEQGVSYADQSANIKQLPEVVPSVRFVLEADPLLLAERINKRVDTMIEAGLLEEIDKLVDLGFTEALTAPQAIGYKEIIAARKGETTLDEAVETIKTATRRYAKRQRSWFRRDKNVIPLDIEHNPKEELANTVCSIYRERLSSYNA